MRFLKEGDKGKAVCHKCGFTIITYHIRDVDFSDNHGIVKNIIAGICDKCNEVISIPRQSMPQIKEDYNKALNN